MVALTDVTGAVQTRYSYGPFGQTASSGTPSDNPYQFAGRELDPNGGFGIYYFRARYMDTLELNRFMARDPQGLSGGDYTTLYAYVGNSPLNGTDPSGQEAFGMFGFSGPQGVWLDFAKEAGARNAAAAGSPDGGAITAAAATNASSAQGNLGSGGASSGLTPQELMAVVDIGIINLELAMLVAEGWGGEISAFGLTAYAVGTATVVLGESAMAIEEGMNNPNNFGMGGAAIIGTAAGARAPAAPAAPPISSP